MMQGGAELQPPHELADLTLARTPVNAGLIETFTHQGQDCASVPGQSSCPMDSARRPMGCLVTRKT
jgi:hypothetical protein